MAEPVSAAPAIDRAAAPGPAAPETAAPGTPPSRETARGKARVSRTRCAMVSCEAPCKAEHSGQRPAATLPSAPCHLARAES